MEVRETSVTSGFDGALGIRFGSVGLFGWTGDPNSEGRTETKGSIYVTSNDFKTQHISSLSWFYFTLNFQIGFPWSLTTGSGGDAGVGTGVTKLEEKKGKDIWLNANYLNEPNRRYPLHANFHPSAYKYLKKICHRQLQLPDDLGVVSFKAKLGESSWIGQTAKHLVKWKIYSQNYILMAFSPSQHFVLRSKTNCCSEQLMWWQLVLWFYPDHTDD